MCDGKQWIGKALFVIALGYVAIGVFPFAPMESDGNHIANGVTQMLLGESPKNTFSYRYEAQSGTYWMTYWLSKISGMKLTNSMLLLSSPSDDLLAIKDQRDETPDVLWRSQRHQRSGLSPECVLQPGSIHKGRFCADWFNAANVPRVMDKRLLPQQ